MGAAVGSRPVPPVDLPQRDGFGRVARPGSDREGVTAERHDLSDRRQRVPPVRVDRHPFRTAFDHHRAESAPVFQGLLKIHAEQECPHVLATHPGHPPHSFRLRA